MTIKQDLIPFALLSLIIIFNSCSNNHQTNSLSFQTMNDTLNVLNNRLKTQNDSIYKVLVEKLANDKTAQKASNWFPKTQYLQYRTNEISSYIGKLISNLQFDSVKSVSDSLYIRLNFYKVKILSIDPEIDEAVNKNAEIITHKFDSVKQTTPEAFSSFMSKKPKEERLFILNQTLLNIKSVENQILIFCNKKID